MVDIEKLGRYDIIRVIGKGAMGVVYEGRDPNLERRVAIKTIRIQSLTPEAAIEYDGRFRTEARSAARLHHPNIVSVFDSGQDQDISYLVMEFIEGEDLKHHLEYGARFSVRASIVMVHELLMALDHAHRQNVVHRDIKPANMLIENSGRVKLTDFGVARIQEPDETHLTQVGGAVGTPKYMSPEQAKGLRGDSRSDVFSACVVLYELLTGQLPFVGENQFVVIHQIVSHSPAPPSTLNPEVPSAMDEVMARAMAKNPQERYATAREFALALRAVAQQMTASPEGQSADVAAELGQFLANRQIVSPPSMLDGSSTGIFGPSIDVPMATTVNHEAELGVWNKVKDSTEPQDLRAYLERFPAGIYALRAQLRLDQLALDNTASRAKTEPFFRPPTAAHDDLDSTIGPFPSTFPADTAHMPEAAPLASTSAPDAAPAGMRISARKNLWLLALLGLLAFGLLLAVYVVLRSAAPDSKVVVAPAKQPEEVILETSSDAPQTAPARASAPAQVLPAKLPLSTAGTAQGAARPVFKPKTVADTQTADVTDVVPQVPPPVASSQSSTHGPSQPGQVCADKVFIFRVACVAEQCGKDKYRQTQECIRFKEMDRAREELHKNQR